MHVESQYSISAVLSVGENSACGTTLPTWDCSTPVNSTATIVNNDFSYNTLIVALNQACITSGAVTFESSIDGINWFPATGFTPSSNFASVGPIYVLQANTYFVAEFNLTAIPYFRLRLSTPITGTVCGSPPDCGQLSLGFSADSFVNPAPASITSTNASVGANGQPCPTSSTQLGVCEGGVLEPVTPTNPFPVTVVGASVANPPLSICVETTSTVVLAANPLRKGLNLTNMSYVTISISFNGNPAVLFSGITLAPGGTFWMDASDFTTAAVNAIADAGLTFTDSCCGSPPTFCALLSIQEWQ
jgi:hypothetical protein